jgi:hypothetical protein
VKQREITRRCRKKLSPLYGNTPKDENTLARFITFYHDILGGIWLYRLYRWAPQFFETWLFGDVQRVAGLWSMLGMKNVLIPLNHCHCSSRDEGLVGMN